MSEPSSSSESHHLVLDEPLNCLNAPLIARIDDAICRVGQFGEVRLVIVKGDLRFIQVTVSESTGGQKRENDKD